MKNIKELSSVNPKQEKYKENKTWGCEATMASECETVQPRCKVW